MIGSNDCGRGCVWCDGDCQTFGVPFPRPKKVLLSGSKGRTEETDKIERKLDLINGPFDGVDHWKCTNCGHQQESNFQGQTCDICQGSLEPFYINQNQ